MKLVFVDEDDECPIRGLDLFVMIAERNGEDVTVLTKWDGFLIGVDEEEHEDNCRLLVR